MSEAASDSNEKLSSLESGQERDAQKRKNESLLFRKIDWALMPILSLLYLLSFLDRSNVGNARVEGLATKIGLEPAEYNTGLAAYFIGYILFEVPSNIVLKRFDPRYWLPTLTLTWGIVTTLQGLVHNKAGFFAIRFFLGVAEAGLFPGVVFVFSMYYTGPQRAVRVAFFFAAAALSGAFGGVLAYGLGRMNGVGGVAGWAWIFIIEGILTVCVSIVAYFLVPSWPDRATFLTTEEKVLHREILARATDAADRHPLTWREVEQAMKDPYSYLFAMIFHGAAFALYTISLFLPTIISGLGYKNWQAQLLTTPPYALAFMVAMAVITFSVRLKRRAPFILAMHALAIAGYIVLCTAEHNAGQYAGTFVVVSGVYAANAVLLSWPAENVSGQTKRATVLAMQISIGNLGSLTGVLLYRPNSSFSLNHYRKAHIITIGYLSLSAVCVLALWRLMLHQNRKRDGVRLDNDEGDEDGKKLLGDRHVTWRYQL